MNIPLVSCIMPTANREKYIPYAISYFLQQDYPRKELVIVDDGIKSVAHLVPQRPDINYYYTDPVGTVGLKRNLACQRAKGEIIVNFDDDDWYANDWIDYQVGTLFETEADICGIRHIHHYSPITNIFWQGDANNRNNPKSKVWLAGATMAYWKSFWKKHPYQDLQKGEDEAFVQSAGARVYAHEYIDGFVAILHPHNTTFKAFEERKHKKNQGV